MVLGEEVLRRSDYALRFFKDDVSTSIDAGDFIRTGVSWLSDH